MTTELLDNTISDLLQNNPAVEYVEPRENPIALREKDSGQNTDAQDSVKQDAVRLFKNDLGFNVRVVMRDDEPWFLAKDVAACIEYKDTSTMVRLCREKDIYVTSASDFDSADLAESGNSRITLISESGLYRILAKCNLPKCEPFESWVFDEVLPSIRKTGSYSIMQTKRVPDSYMIDDPIERAKRWIEEQAEKRQIAAERDEAVARKAEISSRREATAVGILNGVRTRELNLIAQTKVDSYGLPQKSMMFTTDEVIDTDWFQSMFKASTNPFFHEGQEAWKQNRRALKSFLTRRANEQVQADIVTKLGDVVTRKAARSIFAAWKNSKTSSVTFESSMEENGLYDYAVKSRVIMSDLIALRTRYEYRRADGDKGIGIEYEYSYDVWSRVLSSPDFLSIARSHLRDGVSIYDYTRTFNDAKSEGFGLRHLTNE